MIKVCHITSVHPWNDIRIFRKECVSLAMHGYETYLVAFDAPGGIVDGVNIITAGEKPGGRKERIRKGLKKVLDKALQINAGIYHLHDPELLLIAGKLRARGKKVIYDAHEDLPLQVMSKHWIPVILRKTVSGITSILLKYYLRKVDGIVTATPVIEKKISWYNPLTVSVCNYPLLNELSLGHPDPDRKNAVCYIGGLFSTRGLFAMLDAVKDLPVELHLAGAFDPPDLELEARRHPSWEKVVFHGYLGRAEVYRLMSECRAGLVILSPLQSYKESLPIKMFEYMSAELPVICSDFPLWKGIIAESNCGICVDPENIPEIAAAISELVHDPGKAALMGSNGKKAILGKYNWDREEEKLLRFYQQISR